MKDLRSLSFEELKEVLTEAGEKPFRASQLFSWLHEHPVFSCDAMTNLPSALREKLSLSFPLTDIRIHTCLESRKDGTRKYLFLLDDGNIIESVLMRYRHGNTVCISTQVGCRMGCRFCASTIDGLVRNLTPSEMLLQIYKIEEDTGEKVSHSVLMGSGEPMDNLDSVIRFIELISDERGRNISKRNLTVSTCGIPDGIRRFSECGFPVTLALSLHAPDDETRMELMPVAKAYKLREVLAACDGYFEKTGRRVTYEYAVVSGVNDSEEEALKLAALLGGRNAHVNLIPVNPVRERSYTRPDPEALHAFQKTLAKKGINATIRRELGTDISGACGQLRRSYLNGEKGGDGDA